MFYGEAEAIRRKARLLDVHRQALRRAHLFVGRELRYTDLKVLIGLLDGTVLGPAAAPPLVHRDGPVISYVSARDGRSWERREQEALRRLAELGFFEMHAEPGCWRLTWPTS